MKNKQNHKKGFTLIELLVVVAIMGMLAALAVVALNSARARARDARRVSDIKQIQTALELHFLDNNDYPTGTNTHIGGASAKVLSETNGFGSTGSGSVYMTVVPLNPAPYDDGGCTDDTSAYIYTNDSGAAGVSYSITYCIGGPIGQIAEGEHTATPGGIVDD